MAVCIFYLILFTYIALFVKNTEIKSHSGIPLYKEVVGWHYSILRYLFVKWFWTRKYSSRMRTARLFTAGGVWSGGVVLGDGTTPPDRMTDACENIPQLWLAVIKNMRFRERIPSWTKVNVFQVNFYLEAPSIHMSVLQSKIHFGFFWLGVLFHL